MRNCQRQKTMENNRKNVINIKSDRGQTKRQKNENKTGKTEQINFVMLKRQNSIKRCNTLHNKGTAT